jgi:diguanylate cyclase (GGDEF)-like protein
MSDSSKGFADTLKKKIQRLRKDTAAVLTIAYISALLLIGLFTCGSHFINAHIMAQQQQNSEISYYLGKQRTLVQQVSFHASNFHAHKKEIDFAFLTNTIEDIRHSQAMLKDSIKQAHFIDRMLGYSLTSEALYAIYYQSPFLLDKQISVFLEKAKEFQDNSAPNTASAGSSAEFRPPFYDDDRIKSTLGDTKSLSSAEEKRRQEKRLEYISRQFTDRLTPALDAALSSFQKENIEKVNAYYNIQFYATIIIICLLALEAVFIFGPLVNSIKKYNAMLQKHAYEDELTGLKNRRAFMEEAKKELKISSQNKQPIAVALMDLDKFKSVNDTYGHDVGDKVLQHFARVLNSSLRPEDIVGRIGGEEFVVILRKSPPNEAMPIIERLREKIEKTPCRYKDENGQICSLDYTSSIGLYPLIPNRSDTIEELLKKADEALYKAKENGRNNVTLVEIENKTDETTTDQNAPIDAQPREV